MDDTPHEDQWIQVEGRRKARLQKTSDHALRQNATHAHRPGRNHRALSWRNNKDITSFYFSHFPDFVNETYLWNLFQEWGKVWEVFIPNSKNKQGQRYGFVRFKGVEDEGRLERQLDNKIYIEGKKLFVNKPKFQRGGKREAERKGGEVARGWKDSMNPTVPTQARPNSTTLNNMKSYAEVVRHDHKMIDKEIKMSWMGKYEPEAEVVSVDIQTTKNKTTWLDHTWVGHLKNRGMFEKAVDEVQEVVGMDVKVSYWGDDLVILQDMDEAKAEKLNLREHSKGDTTIYSIQKWTQGMTPEFRLAWIHIWGVPLEIWDAEHFQTLLSTFGEVVELDEETADRLRLDVARILIRTKENPIFSKSMVARVNDTEHLLFLREEVSRPYGKRWCRPEMEAFPPSPFTTVLADSDEDSISRDPDGASSEFMGDGRRRRWANAVNRWRAESEVSSDGDVSPHQQELLSAGRLPVCATRHEDYNGPLKDLLHGSGRKDHSISFLDQKRELNEEKGDSGAAGSNEEDIVKGADLRVLYHRPEDNNLALCPAVHSPSNPPNCGLNNITQNRGSEGVTYNLGLNLKGPEEKGEVSNHNLKVYSRKKMGAGSISSGLTNKFDETSRIANKSLPLELQVSGPTLMDHDMPGGSHVAEDIPSQPHTCLSPSPSNSFINASSEDEVIFHNEVAKNLGLIFEEHSCENATASSARMGSMNLAS